MNDKLKSLTDKYINGQLEQIIISNPGKNSAISKIKIRPVLIKGSLMFQSSETIGQKELHKNHSGEELAAYLGDYLDSPFKQIEIKSRLGLAVVLVSKKGTVTISEHPAIIPPENSEQKSSWSTAHNKKKKYILEEGVHIPFMVDLGIMTPDGKVVKNRYDKYRQINRYLEFIEDILPSLPCERELSIIDFGCGKSYLTFAMYYYLHEVKGLNIKITGLDLKSDVIAACNDLKNRCRYDKLEFLQGDIANYKCSGSVDMVVTLHACDTATDYALYNAISWGARVIMCVPCCQHELNHQINDSRMQDILRYGIIKERMASLVTDGLRAAMLEEQGYRTQLLEFIDMEHTPKNILIRAVRQPLRIKGSSSYKNTMTALNVTPTLYKLLHPNSEHEY